MKRYFDKEDFVTFINLLEEDKTTKVFTESTESIEDGSVESYEFRKIKFAGHTIVLYEDYYASIGIIQDTPVAPWEDYAEGVFDDLIMDNEFKVYIESE